MKNVQSVEEATLEGSGSSKISFSSSFENVEGSLPKRPKLKIIFSKRSLATPKIHEIKPEIQSQQAPKPIRLKIICSKKNDANGIEVPKISSTFLKNKNDDLESILEGLPSIKKKLRKRLKLKTSLL